MKLNILSFIYLRGLFIFFYLLYHPDCFYWTVWGDFQAQLLSFLFFLNPYFLFYFVP